MPVLELTCLAKKCRGQSSSTRLLLAPGAAVTWLLQLSPKTSTKGGPAPHIGVVGEQLLPPPPQGPAQIPAHGLPVSPARTSS